MGMELMEYGGRVHTLYNSPGGGMTLAPTFDAERFLNQMLDYASRNRTLSRAPARKPPELAWLADDREHDKFDTWHRLRETAKHDRQFNEHTPTRVLGYAAVYDTPYRAAWGMEVIRPGAFASVLKSGKEITAVVNHNRGRVLATTADGSLKLREDHYGLRCEFLPRNTEDARGAVLAVKYGHATAMSMSRYATGEDVPSRRHGCTVREITEVERLTEVSIVQAGANHAAAAILAGGGATSALTPQLICNAAEACRVRMFLDSL